MYRSPWLAFQAGKAALDDGEYPLNKPYEGEDQLAPSFDLMDVVPPEVAAGAALKAGALLKGAAAAKASPWLGMAMGAVRGSQEAKAAMAAANPKLADILDTWQSAGLRGARSKLAKMEQPDKLRQEMLRRLAAKTKYRRNFETGELEFKLFRGDSPNMRTPIGELPASSWTPDKTIANDFGNYSSQGRRVSEAWIPESKITMKPSLFGKVGYHEAPGNDLVFIGGPNAFNHEKEVIVKKLGDDFNYVNPYEENVLSATPRWDIKAEKSSGNLLPKYNSSRHDLWPGPDLNMDEVRRLSTEGSKLPAFLNARITKPEY